VLRLSIIIRVGSFQKMDRWAHDLSAIGVPRFKRKDLSHSRLKTCGVKTSKFGVVDYGIVWGSFFFEKFPSSVYFSSSYERITRACRTCVVTSNILIYEYMIHTLIVYDRIQVCTRGDKDVQKNLFRKLMMMSSRAERCLVKKLWHFGKKHFCQAKGETY
jgi:hypothetical protein